ncbi:aspartate carbamoyltransferase catalytic subunit [candidate division KSB1 bacterium]|nr:aspartate carbamoyltransferase catalytic subunit [candidate division KSB1 bacterium]
MVAQAWEIKIGDNSVYMLDTNLEENTASDRAITNRLYVDDKETRLKQEMILGIGGQRLLEALGIHPSVYHLNDGHSAFLTLELIHHQMKERDLSFDEAKQYARRRVVFTNHTLVPAGNEVYSNDLVSLMLTRYAQEINVPTDKLVKLGLIQESSKFSMTMLPLRTAGIINAVSKLHSKKAREIWRDHPMIGITNGVHVDTWDMIKKNLPKPGSLWQLHQKRKKELNMKNMSKDKQGIKGHIKLELFDKNGKLKQKHESSNTITELLDAHVADQMSDSGDSGIGLTDHTMKKSAETFAHKHLIGLKDYSKKEILQILDTARSFREVLDRPIKKVPTLTGITVVNLFFEASTRTRISFELAEKRLSADTINFSASTSSLKKGESIRDTAQNIEAMKIDMVVVRHSSPGIPLFLTQVLKSSIINAGDGAHEHPTQALLDIYTLREKIGDLNGVKICIVGDIAHSRVALSNIYGLLQMGADVALCGPPTLIPREIEKLGVRVFYDLDEALDFAQVLNILRIQIERQGTSLFPTLREYRDKFGITKDRLDKFAKDWIIMHPGPINRGIELDSEIADGKYSMILDQVTNGVAVRMAVLYLLSGHDIQKI